MFTCVDRRGANICCLDRRA